MQMQRTKWAEVFDAFDEARRQAQALQQRENQRLDYAILLCLLAASLAGSMILLLHRV